MSNANKKYNESILVLPTARLHELGYFQGFRYESYSSFRNGLFTEDSRFQFLDRNLAETDPSFKQIIPYVSVVCDDEWLTARRSKKVGESRLVGQYSVGLGGHINTTDVDGETNLEPFTLVTRGLVREINEELSFKDGTIPKWDLIGFINDDSNDVGAVHFGLSYLIEVDSKDDVAIIDEGLVNHEWICRHELIKRVDVFESWSQIFIKHFYGKR